ncbi:hypothetical protein [Parasphingopyxis sp.]|uniref:hypothetical protein n=1 Tax=Parasphingopyxis sp. TaxID=1920299 RepID=UPI00260C0E39|nr:hypothetical protein [Parasphingopyxis sp.]
MSEENEEAFCKFKSAEKKSFLQRFTDRWFMPASIIVSGLAAIFAFLGNQTAERARQEAEQASAAAQQAAESARLNLDRERLQQDYGVEITKLVFESIVDEDTRQQRTLLPLISSIQDPKIKRALSSMIEEETDDPDVESEANNIAERAAIEVMQEELARRLSTPAKSFQIFWCTGDNSDRNRRVAENAGRILQSLNDEIVGAYRVGSFSIRSIDAQTERRLSGTNISRPYDAIRSDRGDANENEFAALIATRFRSSQIPVTIQRNRSRSPRSVSIFFCA